MRTNNFSSRKNVTKSIALATLLVVCFVFAFAFTLSFATLGSSPSEETALASTGTQAGGTVNVLGDNKNPANAAEAGFDGFTEESGTYTWTYTEPFTNTYFTTSGSSANVLMNNEASLLKTYSFTPTPGTGTFGWSVGSGPYDNTQLAIVHYKFPSFLSTLSSSFTVTAKLNASVSGSSAGKGLKLTNSKTTSLSGFRENCSSTYTETVTISSGNAYLILAFWTMADNSVTSQNENNGTVSGISVQFTVSTTNSSTVSNKCKEAFSGGNKIVAQSLYESVSDTFTPYRSSTAQSTWPVWYSSIQNNLTSAVDSVSGGNGNLYSYTKEPLGTKGGKSYYKTSKITYVGTYGYAFPYSSGTCTGTDANTTFAIGIKSAQIGDEDDGNSTSGAIFDITSISDGSTPTGKAIYVDGVKVGYAEVKRVNRAKIEVTTYMYQNASVTTKITDAGTVAQTSSFNIKYKGIDHTDPTALNLAFDETLEHYTTNNSANTGDSLRWWRASTFTNDIADNSLDDPEDEYAPYIWFYTVKRYDLLSDMTSDTWDKYTSYAQIKTAELEPFAYGSLSQFEYSFALGKAKGIGGVYTASSEGGNVTRSGYYRFTFYAVDMAGNFGTPTHYYVKADYDNPTFDTVISFDEPIGISQWARDYYTAGSFDAEKYNANPLSYTYGNSIYVINGTTLLTKDEYNNYYPVGTVPDFVPELLNGTAVYYLEVSGGVAIQIEANKLSKLCEITKETKGTWATGETKVVISLQGRFAKDPNGIYKYEGGEYVEIPELEREGYTGQKYSLIKSYIRDNNTNISGNTFMFETGSDRFGVVFDENYLLKRIEGTNTISLAANCTNTTFAKITTDADQVTINIVYDSVNGRLLLTFIDSPQEGMYPNIDWTTAFTMYAGQDPSTDTDIQTDDDWGGVKVLVDRNIPETPTLEDAEGYLKNGLNGYHANVTGDRQWFTESGLNLETELGFGDSLADVYSDSTGYKGVRVYIGVKYVNADADFATYHLTDFVNNYKAIIATISADDKYLAKFNDNVYSGSGYFDSLKRINGGDLDGDQTEISFTLGTFTAGPGMRVIFVWAIDQAGNVSNEISTYYVLADSYTYYISSSPKTNNKLAPASLKVTQTDADETPATNFKRGETVMFTLEMDTELYAPYMLNMTDSEGVKNVLYNYKAEYDWTIANFNDNLTLDNGNLTVSYVIDNFTTVGELKTINTSTKRELKFEFSHREIVTYSATLVNAYTGDPTEVQLTVSNDGARDAFEYYYLNADGTPFGGVPIIPNDALNQNYQVAIYIPTDNANYVISDKNTLTLAEENVGTEDDGYYLIGYQKVKFAKYTINKGSARIIATATSSTFGEAITLECTAENIDISKIDVKLKLSTTVVDYTTLGVGSYQIVRNGDEYGGANPWISMKSGEDDILGYYTISYISAFHTINTRHISIATVADNKLYGDSDPDFRFSVNVVQFAYASDPAAALVSFFAGFTLEGNDGDVYTFFSNGAIRRALGEDYGEYAYTINNAAFDVDANYSLDTVNSAYFNINTRTVYLNVAGQYVVKQASDNFDPAVDYATIVPTFTLDKADLRFANQITGQLALATPYTTLPAGDYDAAYGYPITLGTIASNNNIQFLLAAGDNTYIVYVAGADAVIVKLKDGASIAFVYGTQWTASTIAYDESLFEGLAQGTTVTWTPVISGASYNDYLNAGSYLVKVTVDTVSGDYQANKVFVEPFNVTINPATIAVRPTRTAAVKNYGDPDSVYGIDFELVSINGQTGLTEYAGATVSDIFANVSGAYSRALFEGANMLALGTRYDDAADANGVLYSNDARHYGYAIHTAFVSSDLNFVVDAATGIDATARFEIVRKTITVDSTMFVGVSKKQDGSTDVNYGTSSPVDFKDQLVLSNDEVELDYVAYYDEPGIGERTITFESIGLKGAKAANYVLTVTDLAEGKITILYIDNKTPATRIEIWSGMVGVHINEIVISKQYDGTSSLSINNISITPFEEGSASNQALINILDSGTAVLESGDFGTQYGVSNNYRVNVAIVFPLADPTGIILAKDGSYVQDDVTAEIIDYKGGKAIRITADGVSAKITKRFITSNSFVSITPTPRDYNARKEVEIGYELKEDAIVAGDKVNLRLYGEITNALGEDPGEYGAIEHYIKFADTCAVSNANYTIDIDELNSTYAGDKRLKVQINRAKLLPNIAFKTKAYDGTTNVATDGTLDGTGNAFYALNYSDESALLSEIATFVVTGAWTFNLSVDGKADGNVVIDRDGKATLHNVLVGVHVDSVNAGYAKNYEIYGVDSTGKTFGMKEGDLNYEIIDAVLVEKRVITIKDNDIDVQNKVYDGTKAARATIDAENNMELNIVDADRPFFEITATGEFEQKNIGYGVNVKISNVNLDVKSEYKKNDANNKEYLLYNYVISGTSNVTIQKNIYARPVTFSATLGSRVYTGDASISNNVISYKDRIVGLLPNEVKSYGIQTTGGAFFMDKNVAFDPITDPSYTKEYIKEHNIAVYKKDANYYIKLDKTEIDAFSGQLYVIGAKQGNVYNPEIKSTKSASYSNYVLTYEMPAAEMTFTTKYILATSEAKLAAARGIGALGREFTVRIGTEDKKIYLVKADYTGSFDDELGAEVPFNYLYCEYEDGTILRSGDPNIDETKVVKYYVALRTAFKYIFASDTEAVERALEADAVIGYYQVNISNTLRDIRFVKADYVDSVDPTFVHALDTPVSYSSDAWGKIMQKAVVVTSGKTKTTKYILEEDAEKLAAARTAGVVGAQFVTSENKQAYLVQESYAGEVSGTLAEAEAKDFSDKYNKPYDGTIKFYGVKDIDFVYGDSGVAFAGDELIVEDVSAEFESSSVGDTYVVVKATRLGGKDANNYTSGVLRSTRIPAKIEKITINASLADGEMVYGTNLGNVKGDITYNLNGKELIIVERENISIRNANGDLVPAVAGGVMIKYKEFLVAVGIIADEADEVPAEMLRYMTDIYKRTYNESEGKYSQVASGDIGEYVRLGGTFTSLPTTNPRFTSSRPEAGSVSLTYSLTGGEAANFAFSYEYTGNGGMVDGVNTSRLVVVKKDIYVVAVPGDYVKTYGGVYPLINYNYLDANGNPAEASGETWRNIFIKNGVDYRPNKWFSIFGDSQELTETSRVNDPEYTGANRFDGDYVLNITKNGTFEATNYEIHYPTIELLGTENGVNTYIYRFEGSTISFEAKVPKLIIKMPTMSNIVLASKEGDAYVTTYNGNEQSAIAVSGVKKGDRVRFVDKNGIQVQVNNANADGEFYEGVVILERPIKATDDDTNGYFNIWRSDVDAGVEVVKIKVEQASPQLTAPRDSVEYDGRSHIYDYSKARIISGLSLDPSCFSLRYAKKVEGNYVDVNEMKDAGVYLAYLTYDPHNSNYKTETVEVQYAITKAPIVIEITYTPKQMFEKDKQYVVDFNIIYKDQDDKQISTDIVTNDDLMVQFLVKGEGLFFIQNGQVKSLDPSIIKVVDGKYLFGNSGRYPFQVIVKDTSLKNNFDIMQLSDADSKTESVVAAGVLELVITEMNYVVESEVMASIEVNPSGATPTLDDAILADKFEVRYVYQHNNLAQDDAYYAAIDSKFMDDVANAFGNSVRISAIVRMNLTLNGQNVDLNGKTTTINVELTQEVLDSLDRTVIYQTFTQEDGTTALRKLTDYEIKDGVLVYETDSLGSLVFVEVGRETPMLAVWIGIAVGGTAVLIIGLTTLYVALKKRRLKKEILD